MYNWYNFFYKNKIVFAGINTLSYSIPSNPKELIFDFYMSTYFNIGHFKSNKIEQLAMHTRETLLKQFKEKLLEDVFLIICAEFRHAKDEGQVDSNQLDNKNYTILDNHGEVIKFNENDSDVFSIYNANFKQLEENKYNSMPAGMNDKYSYLENKSKGVNYQYDLSQQAALEAIKESNISKKDFVILAKKIFSFPHWESGYGGEAWAKICEAWLKLNQSNKLEDIQSWIDHIVDLQHNAKSENDTFFDKLKSYMVSDSHEWIKRSLDMKAKSKSPYDLLPHCSGKMKQIAPPIIKELFGTATQSYEGDIYLTQISEIEENFNKVGSIGKFFDFIDSVPNKFLLKEEIINKIKNSIRGLLKSENFNTFLYYLFLGRRKNKLLGFMEKFAKEELLIGKDKFLLYNLNRHHSVNGLVSIINTFDKENPFKEEYINSFIRLALNSLANDYFNSEVNLSSLTKDLVSSIDNKDKDKLLNYFNLNNYKDIFINKFGQINSSSSHKYELIINVYFTNNKDEMYKNLFGKEYLFSLIKNFITDYISNILISNQDINIGINTAQNILLLLDENEKNLLSKDIYYILNQNFTNLNKENINKKISLLGLIKTTFKNIDITPIFNKLLIETYKEGVEFSNYTYIHIYKEDIINSPLLKNTVCNLIKNTYEIISKEKNNKLLSKNFLDKLSILIGCSNGLEKNELEQNIKQV